MDKTDQELNRLLDSYKVANADDALLESIMLQVRASKILAFPHTRPSPRLWLSNAGLMVATALYGFWLGGATPAIQTSREGSAVNYDSVILGPQTMQEVML